MLSPKKKLAKKEITKDPMFALYDQSVTFYEKNKKFVNYGIFGIVAAIVVLVVFLKNRSDNDQKASSDLGKVISIYDLAANDPAQYKVAINGQPEKGIIGLKAIVDKYSGSQSGELARFYLANAYYRTGQIDDAMRQYDSFSGSVPILKSSVSAGLGECYEAKHEYAKAAERYESAAGLLSSNDSQLPDFLRAAGRCYGEAGEKEKAITLFKRIKKEFPATAAAREAERYISQFSA